MDGGCVNQCHDVCLNLQRTEKMSRGDLLLINLISVSSLKPTNGVVMSALMDHCSRWKGWRGGSEVLEGWELGVAAEKEIQG